MELRRDIIVIGASAGGVQALQDLVAGLKTNIAASIFVVIHTSPLSPGILPDILERAGHLPAGFAVDGADYKPGHIYVAPPDHHLLLDDGRMRVSRGPKENGFRPAVDPLFRTSARAGGRRVIGVVLSGSLDDGTLGLTVIKKCGGIAIVQDPLDAVFSSMPESAIRNVDVDHIASISQIPHLLNQLVLQSLPDGDRAVADCKHAGRDVAELGTDGLKSGYVSGPASGFTCPECGGALWEMRGGKLLRYRCHVGHGYTADSLAADQKTVLDAVLWSALRALEEQAGLRRRMANRARQGTWSAIVEQYERQAADAEQRAAIIRSVLVNDNPQAAVAGDGAVAREQERDAIGADEAVSPEPGSSRRRRQRQETKPPALRVSATNGSNGKSKSAVKKKASPKLRRTAKRR